MNKRSLLWAAGVGVAALLACTEITSPLRPAGYPYTLIAIDLVTHDTVIDGVAYDSGSISTDTVDFKWPAGSLPIRIWVEDTFGLPGHMAAAIATWQGIMQYGEVTAQIVGDSASADIILLGMTPPPFAPPAATRRFRAADGSCEGATDVEVSAPDHTKLLLPIRMYVVPKFAMTNPLVPPCLARVTMHELGHALGLFQHSPNPDDLMYSFPDSTVHQPTDADIATILWVYHQPTDLRPVRPDASETP